MEVPLACKRNKEGGAGLLFPAMWDSDAGSPGGFGDQEQGIDVRRDSDGVPVELVEPSSAVLGLGGCDAFFDILPGRRGIGATADAPASELPLVVGEILVDPLELAGEMALLAGADVFEFRFEVG